ncbi:MAG TPA: glycosyltransferase, partial [Candidatus Acidoferrales bacterium]|nr:glycosyltransferase [Candidatus Acidoferrales bacterium]
SDVAAAPAMDELRKLTKSVRVMHIPPGTKRWRQIVAVARGRSYRLTAFTSDPMQEAIDETLARDDCDAVLIEGSTMAGYRLPPNVTCVLNEHNLEYELLERQSRTEGPKWRKFYYRLEARRALRVELQRCARAALLLVTSERERRILQERVPMRPIRVVPNGVDTAEWRIEGFEPLIPRRIVFTGRMDYYPNHQAALFFARHCWPLVRARVPEATWDIVGASPAAAVTELGKRPGITVTGWVDDVRPYLARAALVVVPLLAGSGTRLKILQALAMQKAVVSTPIGCEGLALEPGKHLEIGDGPAELAGSVVRLLNDPTRAAAMGAAGRALVESTYTWQEVGSHLLQALDDIVQRDPTGEDVCSEGP